MGRLAKKFVIWQNSPIKRPFYRRMDFTRKILNSDGFNNRKTAKV